MSKRPERRGKDWAKQIDYSEAEQLLRTGMTQKEVGARFGVTQGAIALAISRGNIKIKTGRAEGRALPWHPIEVEHRDKYLARMLRAHHRREQGLKSAAVIEAQLDAFLKSLAESDMVVDYDPDTEDGFTRVPRRLGVDHGLVREPNLDDRGRPRLRRKARRKIP